MTKTRFRIAAIIAVAVLAATPALAKNVRNSSGSVAATQDTTRTIYVVATHVHFTTADVAPSGDSIGDELVFTAVDENLAGDTVGRLDGYCVFTKITDGSDHLEECMLAHFLQGQGQITLQGSFNQLGPANDQMFAVTGGTGIYRNVTGQAILRFAHRFLFEIQLSG
jgi:hypothetical protein